MNQLARAVLPGQPLEKPPAVLLPQAPAQIGIVEAHVNDAVAKGARALTGGRRAARAGDWYEPTVLVDVDHDMRIMTEETFGPVLPIMKVADEAEAVRRANDSEFGLAATVFASSPREGERIARLLDAGTVNVDDYAISAMCIDVPMGAVSGAVAVALGAFGAHGLEGRIDAEALEWWRTGVLYQALHAPALVAWGAARERLAPSAWVGRLFLGGSVVFSGTLYALALGGPRWLGAVTPLGGTALIAGWLVLAVSAWRAR